MSRQYKERKNKSFIVYHQQDKHFLEGFQINSNKTKIEKHNSTQQHQKITIQYKLVLNILYTCNYELYMKLHVPFHCKLPQTVLRMDGIREVCTGVTIIQCSIHPSRGTKNLMLPHHSRYCEYVCQFISYLHAFLQTISGSTTRNQN